MDGFFSQRYLDMCVKIQQEFLQQQRERLRPFFVPSIPDPTPEELERNRREAERRGAT